MILHVFAHRRRDEAEDETAKLQRGSLLVLGRVKSLDGEVVGVLSQGLMLLSSLAACRSGERAYCGSLYLHISKCDIHLVWMRSKEGLLGCEELWLVYQQVEVWVCRRR